MALFSLSYTENFWTAPDGTRLRYGWFLPDGPSRGTIMCLHGRREFVEKYFELIQDWNQRGLTVVTFDWRGQGRSGRTLANRHKGHVRDFADYRQDAQAFFDAVVRPDLRGPLLVFGFSMGGCIALDWLTRHQPPVAAAIVAAPMLTLPVPGWSFGLAQGIARTMMALDHGEDYVPGLYDYTEADWRFDNNVLTSDPVRFKVIADWYRSQPELALGGLTYHWLYAAMSAIRDVRAALPRLQLPVLGLNGGKDTVIPSHDLSQWLQKMPQITEKIYPAARHDLLMETDAIRAAVLRDMDAFIERFL